MTHVRGQFLNSFLPLLMWLYNQMATQFLEQEVPCTTYSVRSANSQRLLSKNSMLTKIIEIKKRSKMLLSSWQDIFKMSDYIRDATRLCDKGNLSRVDRSLGPDEEEIVAGWLGRGGRGTEVGSPWGWEGQLGSG